MTRAGFVVHFGRDAALRAAEQLIGRLRDSGIATRQLGGESLGADETMRQDDFAEALDLVVSVGGDGTFLRAAHVASQIDAPVLGVKVGRMGFLTEVEPDDAEPLIRRALEGNARVEERMAALAAPEEGTQFNPQWGLNEVIVEKRARHRLIKLAVYVDGTYVTTFSADGVIVATPTGSTAYSFSARGPIVSPSVRSLIVTPVAAHMVFDRSFVLDAASTVTLRVEGEERGLLSADGRQSVELPVGARIAITKAARSARLVRRDDHPDFLALVREKFELPGSPETEPADPSEPDEASGSRYGKG
ncbi:MAG: NAD(+)/NADH kinase [Actinomycetota bacterium]